MEVADEANSGGGPDLWSEGNMVLARGCVDHGYEVGVIPHNL